MGESGFNKEHTEQSKFDVLKEVISKFIKERFDDNVGVTVFGSYAFSSVPLTYDMNAVAYLINFLDVGIAGENTAIGEGIANATQLLKMGQAKEKVMLLITDGYHNSGTISPKDALDIAVKNNIKIYTIGIGKKGDYDEALLKLIATNSHAKMFGASDASKLEEIYSEIDTLEQSQIRSQNYLNKQLLAFYPLLAAALLLFILIYKRKV